MPPQPVLLADYQPYPFEVAETRLAFDIRDGETSVRCEMEISRREANVPLVLNGADLELDGIAIDGRPLGGNEYAVEGETLTIFDVPDACRVRVDTRIKPEENTALEGLYKSGAMYCTQCEAEGFRKIVYYPDRPDVLSRFTTTITADAERYPVLLSNGNPVADETRDGRRTVTWRDPFPKPSYLFALVCGDLAVREDVFVTCTGREVALRIYSEPHNIGQCAYAMDVLKRAMRWDEERFGREYDLDIFMIVAVESFNMGAMENKGLNIFNTSCVLATPDTATDAAYQRVEAVVAHEYFHNWSGNRVTCRDWFQLSLKEGFTVYRDAEFSSDMNSRTVKRVEDVEFLRSVQFAEDGGLLAHPVRPDSYLEINNFYTTTVYEKGAEVVRMLATILGRSRFRAGADAYFARPRRQGGDGGGSRGRDGGRRRTGAAAVPPLVRAGWHAVADGRRDAPGRPLGTRRRAILPADARATRQAAVPHSARVRTWSAKAATSLARLARRRDRRRNGGDLRDHRESRCRRHARRPPHRTAHSQSRCTVRRQTPK